MRLSFKLMMLTLVVIGSTSFVSSCTTREMVAAGAGAAGGYVVGKETR